MIKLYIWLKQFFMTTEDLIIANKQIDEFERETKRLKEVMYNAEIR